MSHDSEAFLTLLTAWRRWNKNPHAPVNAEARVAAVIAFAVEVDVSSVEVSRRMSAGRRAGMSYENVLRLMQDEPVDTAEPAS